MKPHFEYDYVVIGSGFGGSVAAWRLTEKGYRVGVLEMGKRWRGQDFPKTNMNLRKFLWKPGLFMYGIQQYTLLKHAYIAHGCGVGGGSLVFANTLLVPPSAIFAHGRWPTDEDWEAKLAPHYATAKRMLGAVEAKRVNPVDEMLAEVVDGDLNKGRKTFRRHTVSVFYGETPGKRVPDPYFGGDGPERRGCIECGECMSGCKHGAKNTLDLNYLWLAERRGAEIIPETRVTDIVPLEGGGYAVHTECSTRKFRKARRVFHCKGVVLSAGVLGTVRLLLQCKERGTLPKLSDQLGQYVRTNAEAFGSVTARDRDVDFTEGIAITSGVEAPDGTHLEAVRWGRGHDFVGLMTTVLFGGGPPWPRRLRWLGNVFRHPVNFLRTLWPFGWGQRSTVVMGMRPSDSYLRLRLRRKGLGHGLDSELSEGEPVETYMPVVHEVTKRLAAKMKGTPQGSVVEAVFNTCTTAHILGGATMGRDVSDGVCDARGRVFGYEGMYVCDGSLVPANLTVNPSLTITALSEYVMSEVPGKEEAAADEAVREDAAVESAV